jgi:hypothetical protein
MLRNRENWVRRLLWDLIRAVLVGVVAGLVVSFLLSTPRISLTNTRVTGEKGKICIKFEHENRGKSTAKDLTAEYRFCEIKANAIPIKKNPYQVERMEPGDNFSYEAEDLPLADSSAIVCMVIEFNDTWKPREWINKLFRINQYELRKWAKYIPGSHSLAGIDRATREEYEKKFRDLENRKEG